MCLWKAKSISIFSPRSSESAWGLWEKEVLLYTWSSSFSFTWVMVSMSRTLEGSGWLSLTPPPWTKTFRVYKKQKHKSIKNQLYESESMRFLQWMQTMIWIKSLLTRVLYSTSSRSRRLSLSVYLAFPVTASTGPLSTWCFMALNSM